MHNLCQQEFCSATLSNFSKDEWTQTLVVLSMKTIYSAQVHFTRWDGLTAKGLELAKRIQNICVQILRKQKRLQSLTVLFHLFVMLKQFRINI